VKILGRILGRREPAMPPNPDPREVGFSLMRKLFSDEDYRFVFSPMWSRMRVYKSDGLEIARAKAELQLRSLGEHAVKPLIAAMNDVERDQRDYHDFNKEVRRRAAWALGTIGNSEAIAGLVDALSHSYTEATTMAEDWLIEMGNIALEPLVCRLNDAAVVDASRIVNLLRPEKLGNRDAIQPLIGALSHANKRTKSAAIKALGEFKAAEAVDGLVEVIGKEQDATLRLGAISALQSIRDPRAAEALVAVVNCEHDHISLRSNAAYALALTGDFGALEQMMNFVKIQASCFNKNRTAPSNSFTHAVAAFLKEYLTTGPSPFAVGDLKWIVALPDHVPAMVTVIEEPGKVSSALVDCTSIKKLARLELERRNA
jgi:HEAT repeat protein